MYMIKKKSHKCSSNGSYHEYYWSDWGLNLGFHISPHLKDVSLATRLPNKKKEMNEYIYDKKIKIGM
jgi:hypothetical protein